MSGFHFNMALDQVRRDFELYAMSGDSERLRAMLAEHTKGIPFHQADGLGAKINAILGQLQSENASGAAKPIATAYHQVVQTIRADVRARFDDGSIVVGP